MSAKRDNELIKKFEEIINSESDEQKKKVMIEMQKSYESNTFKEWGDRTEFYNDIVDRMVNDFGFDYKSLAEKMANNHPTLQQSFMRLCANFIMRMAEKSYYDARNKASVQYAKSIMDNVGEECFPFI